jgi:hypothetical protein
VAGVPPARWIVRLAVLLVVVVIVESVVIAMTVQ